MPYIALYRKLRPKTFNDVVGQSHVVRTLVNQINSNKISHAYLFCGTRGTGKTSIAKIFAKSVNCTEKKNGEPCGECNSCVAISENRSMNVIEIDAASNNGVDNIRDIREEVKYPPTEGVYKVYIIDEVHMLSSGAFNALLKTLEEPPNHVIFILATTDPQKIPATIHSRCQRFEFKRISTEDMTNSIKEYITEENILLEDKAIKLITEASDGAMRDALSILDQSISLYDGEEITVEKVLNIIGSVDKTVLFSITEALVNRNSEKCIEIIGDLISNGRDVIQFVSDLILHFRNLLVASSIGNVSTTALDLSEDNINKLIKQGESIEASKIINFISVFSDLQTKMKFDKQAKILLEVACIKLCNPQEAFDAEGLSLRITQLEKAMKNGIAVQQKSNPEIRNEKPKVIIKKAIPDDINKVKSSWTSFVAGFEQLLRGLLDMSIPAYLEGEVLHIVASDASSASLLKSKENLIKEQLIEKFDKDFMVNFISKNDYMKRHNEIYGVKDESIVDINQDILGEKINMDITFE